ncbi:glycosyltransferase [Demequina iriomotensis]|uniref:glycosyltransferase n=1 Tax=Demequina iriomotensis TaxID=1536641 RepID=UPI0007830BA0|nr:glycosyltransferase [Demequina iriomotensis]
MARSPRRLAKAVVLRTPVLGPRLRNAQQGLRDAQQQLRDAQTRLEHARARVAGLEGRLDEVREASQQQQERLRERVQEARQDASSARRARRDAARTLDRMRRDAATGDVEGLLESDGERDGVRARAGSATLVEALSRGEDPGTALVAYVRATAQLRDRWRAPVTAEAFARQGVERRHADAARALHAILTGHRALAQHFLDRAEPGDCARLFPVEYAAFRLREGAVPAQVCDEVLAHATPSPHEIIALRDVFLAVRDLESVARLGDEARLSQDSFSDEQRAALSHVDATVARARAAGSHADAPGTVRLAVMSYGRASSKAGSINIGDYIQTIASLSHVVRRSDVTLAGDDELVASARRLQDRIRPDLRLDGTPATVELLEISRDDSTYDDVPPATWMLAFGWHMHPDALGRHDFPYHPNLVPVFVSFHCNRRELLTAEAVEYLRRAEPIGCRDWYTVDLLTQVGVRAFFSGCLTTTVDAYVEDRSAPASSETGYVDVKNPGGTVIAQERPEVAGLTLAANLDLALETLDGYRRDFGHLVTSRLHCYLPAASIGIPTRFTPRRESDIRFEGLLDAGEDDLATMRETLRETLIRPVLDLILAGAEEPEVRARWREITEPLVDVHVARRSTEHTWPAPRTELVALARELRAAAWSSPATGASDAIDVCVALDRNYLDALYTMMTATTSHLSRPMRMWALSRGLDQADFEDFARAFPEIDATFIACDSVDYGEITQMIEHITVSTMDRLLLPELLDDLDRVLYLDLDLLPLVDIAPLFDTPLGDAALAARPAIADVHESAMAILVGSTRGLPGTSRAGWQLQSLLHREVRQDFTVFNAGVLVMNLGRMRRDRFTERFAAVAGAFGLHDQHLLNIYAGPDYVPLDAPWNAWPLREVLDEPRIAHWLGHVKPWRPMNVPLQDEWRAAERAAAARRAR